MDECEHWHNEMKPHRSLDFENSETLIQLFTEKAASASKYSSINKVSEITMEN